MRDTPDIWSARHVVALLLFVLSPALWASEPELNRPLTPLRIKLLSGQVAGQPPSDRILVVNLWATWCVPCRKEMPDIEAFYKQYKSRGVDVIAVSLDDRDELAKVKQVMTAYSFPAALAVDSDLRGLGRLRHVPATFVIDKNGVLKRNGWHLPASVDFATLESAVLPLLEPVVSASH